MSVLIANLPLLSDRTSWVFQIPFKRQLLSEFVQSPVDRDTGRWKLDPSETQRRRETFWELYVYDSWQARRLLLTWISSDHWSLFSVSLLGVHQRSPLPMWTARCHSRENILSMIPVGPSYPRVPESQLTFGQLTLGNTGSLPNAWRLSMTRCLEQGRPPTPPFCNSIGSFELIKFPRLCRLPASAARLQSQISGLTQSRSRSRCNATSFWQSEK